MAISSPPFPKPSAAETNLLLALLSPSPDWLTILSLIQSDSSLASKSFADPTRRRRVSALHAAAASFHVSYTSLLLARGAAASTSPWPPLVACAAAPLRSPRAEESAAAVVRLLVSAGADPCAKCGEDGCALDALGHAIVSKSTPRVSALVEAGARVNGRYRDGSSPLHLAAATGSLAVVRILVENGASVDVLNFAPAAPPRTPADCAYAEGFIEVGDWLRDVHGKQRFRFVRE